LSAVQYRIPISVQSRIRSSLYTSSFGNSAAAFSSESSWSGNCVVKLELCLGEVVVIFNPLVAYR
jgi:hypothetical protein